MSIRSEIRKFVPRPLLRLRDDIRESRDFSRLGTMHCDPKPLGSLGKLDLRKIFSSADIEAQWEQLESETSALGITDEAGGLNPGDRKAVYYLISHLRPRSVLEIGTHIGASTVNIAAALKADSTNRDHSLLTVDILDVNDPVTAHWLRLGSTLSPAEMIRRIGAEDFVEFETAKSTDFLSQCDRKFDLVFLDGNHDATDVYQEIAIGMNILNDGGYMLLHDYFPDLKPLWSDRAVIRGPVLATRRLQAEGAAITVEPLGELPWATKLSSNVTSLAVLGSK